ncbi:MAG TPA: protein kinase, partial [Polyangiales bacterium]
MPSLRASAPGPAAGTLVAGRYLVERLLGAGGMGEVQLVVDQTTERRVALKRLRSHASEHQRRLFEREFHTLASLKHDHIVEAYDYGIADGEPYYTMELLEGSDLRELAPMPWVDACRCLRDVASTLGVLHARRLLHRDLSPRNVWRNQDGSIKLLDFGALASFGVPRDISGTPAFIPPEALNTQPLDQRSDLYMLGALGYWLLSGSLPYNARQLGDLFEAWKLTPPLVSQRVLALGRDDLPPPPAELDALIESLLSQSPAGRPGSTAEIVDALSQIAGLPRITTASAAQGYIHSKAFVGRAREYEQLQTHLNTAASGVGGAFVYEGAPGIGRSRLLAELDLRARLAGACVLSLSAGSFQGAYGVARALALALLDAAPEEAARAGKPLASVLGHLDPALASRLGGPRLKLAALSDATGERRVRLQAALRDLILRVALSRLLVVVIDDLHLVDDSSAALLAALGGAADHHKLLLLTSTPSGLKELCAPAQALRAQANRVHVAALTAEETHDLLRSVFDDVPNLARFAERLQRVAQGNPAHCMELAEHLVRSGSVRYLDGSWVLPPELSGADLPNSRDAALLERLKALASEPRALARVLTVATGTLTRETCHALSPLSAEATSAALTALESAGILGQHQDCHHFSHALL